jgi:uncharacterized protein (TIGR00251 family)
MIINVKVTPYCKMESVEIETDLFGEVIYKVKTNKPAEDGKANEAVVALLANHFNVAKSKVIIIKGRQSRLKMVDVASEAK